MKRQQKNLNEEIERIKSLFTDERLYGNLVEQGILKKIGGKIGTGYQNVKSAIILFF